VGDLDDLAEMALEDNSMARELQEQLADIEARIAALEEERLFSGKYDAGDAIVTINSGAGGTDAQDWAEMVLRMEMRWAQARGFKVELLEASPGEEAGIKSAAFRAEGENAYGLFGAEKGVHRLVRISPFDSQARRQTAFAEVQVAPVIDDVGDVVIDMDDVGVDTYRASGAGGQHVNKTDSAVRLTHRPSGIVVQCQNERSQTANKEAALKVLRGKLVELRERERMEEIAKEKGAVQDVGWGSQIRSYVLAPYTMVKDHRTNVEVGDPTRVLDGDLDGFIRAELLRRAGAASGPKVGGDGA
jgi:peptide chain release factor 2